MAALSENLPDEKDQAVLKTRETGVDISLEDLDLTSLRAVEVCMHIEESLGIEIDLDEFEEIETLSALIAHCEKLVADQSA